jgi:HSP20 family molecular chaperone IbpA
MERMQEDIDRAIRRATEQFRLGAGATPFSRDLGYSSSLDVRDRRDHFEVRAYLPDAETKDVKVKTKASRHCVSPSAIANSRRANATARRRPSTSSAPMSNS